MACSHLELSISVRKRALGRVLVLDFYDGPVVGLAQCAECATWYRFERFASSEKEGPNLTSACYFLGEIKESAPDLLVDALGEFEIPKWPIWCPKWAFPSERDRRRIESIASGALCLASRPERVVIADSLIEEWTAVAVLTIREDRNPWRRP